MSLDVSLYVEIYELSPQDIGPNIKDWDRLSRTVEYDHKNKQWLTVVYSGNITHNLSTMADSVGIYKSIWRPEENGIQVAGDVVNILQKGLIELRSNPVKYKNLEPKNGWGRYSDFINFVEDLLKSCIEYPKAKIEVSR